MQTATSLNSGTGKTFLYG